MFLVGLKGMGEIRTLFAADDVKLLQTGLSSLSISRAGGTPGWLWILRPGSLILIPHQSTSRTMHGDSRKRKPPAAQRKLRPGTRDCPTRPNRPVARAPGSSPGSTV
jgi:hypothetical protein